MDEQWNARSLIQVLSADEVTALRSLIGGESLDALAHRTSISLIKAADLQDSMKWKLGAVCNADAVRIGLMAGLP